MLIALVVVVRDFDQPWRGIVDGGVVVGLTWGLVALLFELGRAIVRGGTTTDPDLP